MADRVSKTDWDNLRPDGSRYREPEFVQCPLCGEKGHVYGNCPIRKDDPLGALRVRVEALEKALDSSEELLQALIVENQPHRALQSWGKKWSVHVGYARASYAERKLRAIRGELARVEAARKLLEPK